MAMDTKNTIRQVGYVVKDLNAALDYWINVLGVGPWAVAKEITPQNYKYRGESGKLVMDCAVTNSGDLQIELIEDKSEGMTFYKECMNKGNYGINHHAIWPTSVESYNEIYNEFLSKGYTLLQEGELGAPEAKFSYFDNEAVPGHVIEVSILAGPKKLMYEALADIARYWDGENPIRYFNL